MCWKPIDGAILRIVQVVYRWGNSRICAIYYPPGVHYILICDIMVAYNPTRELGYCDIMDIMVLTRVVSY